MGWYHHLWLVLNPDQRSLISQAGILKKTSGMHYGKKVHSFTLGVGWGGQRYNLLRLAYQTKSFNISVHSWAIGDKPTNSKVFTKLEYFKKHLVCTMVRNYTCTYVLYERALSHPSLFLILNLFNMHYYAFFVICVVNQKMFKVKYLENFSTAYFRFCINTFLSLSTLQISMCHFWYFQKS